MSHVLQAVVARFVTIFGEPKSDNPEALYSEYVRALKGFSVGVLEPAVDEVIKHHTFPTWPTPGEVYKAASSEGTRQASRFRAADLNEPCSEPPADWSPPSEEDRQRNRKAIESMRRMYGTHDPIGTQMQAPTRAVMDAIQANAIRTYDGRKRHLKDYMGESSE